MSNDQLPWLANRTDQDLFESASPLAVFEIRDLQDMEEIVSLMIKGGPAIMLSLDRSQIPREDQRPPRRLWENFKVEFKLLVCTEDPKYDGLRMKLNASKSESNTIIVALIAASVAEHLGVAAGTLTAFCAVCLSGVLRLSRESFCREV